MTELKRLNRLLRDYLGTTPTGDPLYLWMHTRDKRLFYHEGRLDGITPKVHYEFVPQVQEIRWTLAMWQAPPSRAAWGAQFQGQVAYPHNGYYVAAATPHDPLFERGVEPTERITMYVIGARKQQLEMGMQGVYRAIKENQEAKKRESGRVIDDILSDRWTPHVPGAKDHVSYASV